MALKQETRFIAIDSPLGDDLVLTAFNFSEEVSRLFASELELTSNEPTIDANKLIGKSVTVSIATGDSMRYFNGHISRFTADYGEDDITVFRAEMVPWLWFLTQTADCRIFQNMTVVEIVEKIFNDLSFTDYTVSDIAGQHPELEYCVQYRETDFNFISRILEQEGIFYFFKHEDGKHTMVLADGVSAYKDLPEKEVECPSSRGVAPLVDHITAWEHQYSFFPGKWAHTDYNFETPSQSLMATSQTKVKSSDPMKKYEVYDYPGEYLVKADGQESGKYRMEEAEQAYDHVSGASSCRTFSAGGKFTLTKHFCDAESGKSYVVTSVQHAARGATYGSGGGAPEQEYTNSFTCIPASVVFRPARTSPNPVVSGVQTAVVVGPAGEEIYCDKYGRVKVQFHWDREGQKDEESSCWIRVAHNVAGKKWGFLSIPRIGQEVVVDFLEGNPNRPLIVGSVYNAEQMPHYTLPDEMSKSYIKTNSTKGGDGYNEIMFEDKKDEERLFLHAQKDLDMRVKNDSRTSVGGNAHQIIGPDDGSGGGDLKTLIHQDQHLNVKRHDIAHIEGNSMLTVGFGHAGGGNRDVVIENDQKEKIGGKSDLLLNGDRNEKIGGMVSQDVQGAIQIKSGGDIALEAGPANQIHLKAGMTLIIEAGMQLSLKGPGGFVDIGPAGVTIQGTLVNINSGGAAGAGNGCRPNEPGEAEQAEPTEPDEAWDSQSGMKSRPD